MESKKDIIESRLKDKFNPALLEVVDDSALHAGHAAMNGVQGGESHFKVRIVSGAFAGMSRVDMHRAVNEAVKDLFKTGLHALNIDAKAS